MLSRFLCQLGLPPVEIALVLKYLGSDQGAIDPHQALYLCHGDHLRPQPVFQQQVAGLRQEALVQLPGQIHQLGGG